MKPPTQQNHKNVSAVIQSTLRTTFGRAKARVHPNETKSDESKKYNSQGFLPWPFEPGSPGPAAPSWPSVPPLEIRNPRTRNLTMGKEGDDFQSHSGNELRLRLNGKQTVEAVRNGNGLMFLPKEGY